MVINFESMKKLNEITPKELLLSIRDVLSNKQITFVQVGVNDGIAHDIAVDILRENDKGVFIEPMEQPFSKMCINKSNFKDSAFITKLKSANASDVVSIINNISRR
jgi:hypothetical protein